MAIGQCARAWFEERNLPFYALVRPLLLYNHADRGAGQDRDGASRSGGSGVWATTDLSYRLSHTQLRTTLCCAVLTVPPYLHSKF